MQHLRSSGPDAPRLTLLELAGLHGASKCSDPRDRVYGFRALAIDGHQMPVDYSCDTFDLLIQTVSLHNREKLRQGDYFIRGSGGGNIYFYSTEELEKDFCDGTLEKATGIGQHMLLESRAMETALRDLASDCLILPLSKELIFSEDSRGKLYNSPDIEIVSDAFSDMISILINDSGGIIDVQWDSGTELTAIPSLLPWHGHIWPCAVTRAVHLSRLWYAYCMFLRQEDSFMRLMLVQASKLMTRPNGIPRRCNCNRTRRHPIRAPWKVPDESCR